MQGIAGFIGHRSAEDSNLLIQQMCRAMDPDGKSEVKRFLGHGFGLGWVGSSSRLANPRPTRDDAETVYVVMQGELFNQHELCQMLARRGCRSLVENDAEVILQLYKCLPEFSPGLLKGSFILSIWDAHKRRLTVVTDRFGTYPLYFAVSGDSFLFASTVRALLACEQIPRQIDAIGLGQFLVFDHLFLDRTIVDGISYLTPASILTYEDSQYQIETYWKPEYPTAYRPLPEQDYIEGFRHYLHNAIQRRSPNGYPAGVLLSGGFDSRLILAGLCDIVDPDQLQSFTFGIHNCDDVRFAKEVSRELNVVHQVLELKSDYLRDLGALGVELTDGMSNVIHFHGLATQQARVKRVALLYKGLFGDILMGIGTDRSHLAQYTSDDLPRMKLDVYERHGVHIFSHRELDNLLSERYRKDVGRSVQEGFHLATEESGSPLMINQRHYFFLRYRFPRLSLNGVELVRTETPVRLPYCDADLVEFVLTMPPGFRFDRYIAKAMFVEDYQQLSKIPVTENGLPLVPCLRELCLRASSQLRWRLKDAGLYREPIPKRRRYAEYSLWMRTTLREWLEEILLSERSMQRGFFNPAYVRRLVEEHMSGADHHKKLGSLLAIELWHRKFIA